MKKLVLLVALFMTFSLVPAHAAEMKVGYVDLQKALNVSDAGKAAKEQIAKKVKEYEGQVDSRKQELQKSKEDLEKQALLLSDDARAAKERDYQQRLKDFQRFTKDIQEELQMRDADFTRKILEEIIKIVGKLGKDEKYTVILEKNESSLIYADASIDLTDRIIDLYNASAKK